MAEGARARETVAACAARADAALRAGRFRDAVLLFRQVISADPNHRGAHVAVAAILAEVGRQEDARALLRDYFARNPLPPSARRADQKLVLRMRGFDHTTVMIGRNADGACRTVLRGGHFTTQYLLLKPDFAMKTYTIARDNILKIPPPRADLMLNTIAEPDIEGSSLVSLAKYLETAPETPIINRPERVMETARDANWRRLRGFPGVTFPRTQRVTHAGDAAALRAEVARVGAHPPFIIREAGTQTGRTTTLVRRAEDLDAYAAAAGTGEHFVIDYREILFRGEFFRKLRLFHIDGAFYPVVCHIDRTWNVHGANRKEVMRTDEALMAEEKRFLADWRAYVGAPAADAIDRLGAFVGLEFFGIDFTIDEGGGVFIYEMNPAMRHSFDHAKSFPYKQPHDEATSAAFAAMIEKRLAG